jgi:hypothetical protein
MEKELNKQTAVQWFIEQLEQKGDASENVSIRRVQISIDVSDYLELKRQAKQMEKEQISDAWENGFMSTGQGWNGEVTPEMHNETLDTEQYYEQTYGGNK